MVAMLFGKSGEEIYNASLIAAAPRLLTAARLALACLYGSNSDDEGAGRALEQAIADATTCATERTP